MFGCVFKANQKYLSDKMPAPTERNPHFLVFLFFTNAFINRPCSAKPHSLLCLAWDDGTGWCSPLSQNQP